MDLVSPPGRFGLGSKCVVAVPAEDEIVWRIAANLEPAINDFLSFAPLGDPDRGPTILSLGVSVYSTRQQAEQIRDEFRRGQHVVAIELAANRGIHLARTGRTPGHHTIWGKPDRLLAAAVRTAVYS
jgi:hypothetical protein